MDSPDYPQGEAEVFVEELNAPGRGEGAPAAFLNRRLRALRFDVARLHAENINFRGEIGGLRAHIHRIESELQLATAHNATLTAMLRDIHSSFSWKVVSRLSRLAKFVLRRGRGDKA
jgi:hypothetical protein